MILPDLVLPSRVDQRWLYSGVDSPEFCLDKQHFQNYPYTVDYVYNSRGFRDQEWPDSDLELRDAIWCIGDSFTVGLGQSVAHIWPQVLATATGRRCINISMDGASNDWIWRRTQDIWREIRPQHMVIMWSFTHRRELQNSRLSDEQRRVFASRANCQQDLDYTAELMHKVYEMKSDIVQCTVPEWTPKVATHKLDYDATLKSHWQAVKGEDWPACPSALIELASLPNWIIDELKNVHCCYYAFEHYLTARHSSAVQHLAAESWMRSKNLAAVIHVAQLDRARDYYHFDILTSQWVVDQIMQRLRD